MISFKEQYVYERYKNTALENSKKFEEKVRSYKIDAKEVYRKIVNYQIKKYGKTLTVENFMYKPEGSIMAKVHSRKKQQRKSRGIGKNAKIERWTER